MNILFFTEKGFTMEYPKPEGTIDPAEYLDQPIWCVTGAECAPSVFCCRIAKTTALNSQPVIWGFSVYKGDPGFRTLGQRLDVFREQNPRAVFFATPADATSYLYELITHKVEGFERTLSYRKNP